MKKIAVDDNIHGEQKNRRCVIMALKVILEPNSEGGYTAIVPSLPGCISEGDTREKALANIRKAIQLYLEPVGDDLSFHLNAEELEIEV